MRATAVFKQAAAVAARTPMIRFLGKRTVPESVDHTPRAHPLSPSQTLPDSFVTYRNRAQQHGPLGNSARIAASYGGAVGGNSGSALGSVNAKQGEFFDRNELPQRFRRMPWSQAEMEAVETGGASMFA